MEAVERLPNRETRYRFVLHPPERRGEKPTFSYLDMLTGQVLVDRAPSIREALRVVGAHQVAHGWRQTRIEA